MTVVEVSRYPSGKAPMPFKINVLGSVDPSWDGTNGNKAERGGEKQINKRHLIQPEWLADSICSPNHNC